ncbi:MAG: hypothetical protein AAFO82_21045, partial [Bacteroidota bacterium]
FKIMKKLFSLLVAVLGMVAFVNAQTTTSAPETLTNGTQSIILDVTNITSDPNNGRDDLVVTADGPNGVNARAQVIVAPKGSGAAFINVANFEDPKNAGLGRLGTRGDYAAFSIQNQGTPSQKLKNFAIELDPFNEETGESFVVTANAFNVTGTPDILAKVNASGIETIEARVQATVTPPDYVFAKDYKLRSLEEVETYINENSHLPEIPSAAEFEADGIKLGKMSFDLLKKVEELTLYMIELKKENEALKTRVTELENK